MPRGLNRSDPNNGGKSYRDGSPVTTPVDFGNDITLPHDFGNDVNWVPDPAHFGNAVTWTPSPAHFGNKIAPPFPAPTFTSATPNHGPIAGGTPIAIVGSGFSATGLEVLIGGAPCTSVVASDDNNLTCDSPAGSVGSTDIEIITDGGSVDTPGAWTYDAPAIALVDHTVQSGTSFNTPGITTAAINSTGASMLFLAVNGYPAVPAASSGAITITDTYSNTWLPVPSGRGAPSPGIVLYYCPNPIVGSGHTVTVHMSDTGAGGYLAFSAWSNTQGLIPLGQVADSVNSTGGNISPPFVAGAVVPKTGDLVLSCIAGYNGFSSSSGLPASVNSGFTIIDSAFNATAAAGSGTGGFSYGYLLSTNGASVNPTWTMQAVVTTASVYNVIFTKATTGVQLKAFAKAASGSGALTTAAIDTTGANFLIASVQQYTPSGGPATMSDSKGNTWHRITWNNGQDSGKPCFYYAYNATVGTGHTFTGTSSVGGGDMALNVMAFSGVKASSDPFESGNDSATIASPAGHLYQAAAAITPASAGDLVVTAIGNVFATNPLTVFISVDQHNTTAGWTPQNSNDPAGAMAWSLAQNNSTALQPSWYALVSGSDFNRGYNNFAVFAHA